MKSQPARRTPMPVRPRSSSERSTRRDAVNGIDPLALTEDIKNSIRVLIVDDEQTLRQSCASVLTAEGYDVTSSGNGHEAATLLKRRQFDIVLLDLHMTQMTGMQLLEVCLGAYPETIVIIMTGNPSIGSSIEALRAGAWDYLPKPFAGSHLQILIGRAVHTILISRESEALNEALHSKYGHSDKVGLLGTSVAFQRVIALAAKVAATDASVFISGESGTGKEQIAQYIHHHSRRNSRQLVAVNCAALPDALLETEMFGHVQGAFTGAVRDKPGLLEVANGGTLFLDEITEMPALVQAKLLRVIQDGVVRRLGSNTTNAVVNVRFIAATNRDLTREQDILRTDLFYRLCVVPIHIPPLRERKSDIPVLAQSFLNRYWAQHREGGSATAPTFSREAMESLQARPWPGNVRELQNVIEHAVVLLESGAEIRPGDLPQMGTGAAPVAAPVVSSVPFDELGDGTYHGVREKVLTEFELGYLTWLVDRARGNMSKAARIAGVDRTTLYRLIEKHGLHRDTILSPK
jgi:DNA-binding NtrC family response regulator